MRPHQPDPARHAAEPAGSAEPGFPRVRGNVNLREAAHRYADSGWPVFPCQPGTKIPATRHGHLDATASHVRAAGLIPAPIAAVRTPSGGAHLYYTGTTQRTGAMPAKGLDFRAAGGSIVAPPSWSSTHRRRYQLLSAQPGDATIDWAAIRHLLGPPHPRLPRLAIHCADARGAFRACPPPSCRSTRWKRPRHQAAQP